MKLKSIAILLALVIIAASLFAGCINPIEKDNEDDQETVVAITETLTLNETKNIAIEDTSYNITVTKIEGENVIIAIGTEDSLLMAKKGVPIEVDIDLDGINELEVNVTNITAQDVTIELKLTTSTSKFRYIQDDTGVTVKVPKKIDKIISLAPSITEILFHLNVGNKIVGRDIASNYPSECKSIDVVSTSEGVDLEMILVNEPDIILMDKTLDLYDTNYNLMKDFGLYVFRVYPKTLQDVLDNIELIGKITNTQSTAQEVIADLEIRINTVKIRETLNPKVLHIIYYDGSSSPWVGTSSTFSGDLIRIAGGQVAVKDDAERFIQITVEQLLELNPDIIFTSQDQNWPTPSRDAILNDELLKDITAVKNDLVIDVDADLVDRPGPRLVDGLELFSDYITS